EGQKVMFSRWPESQAQAILEGQGYKLAAFMVTEAALLSRELRWEDFQYVNPTGLPATRQEVIQDLYQLQEKRLIEKFDPLEIYPKVIMPLVKDWLESIERYMVEQCYRVPKWERPKLLKEIEADPGEA
ncbi:unnamed protein product, partial [marine sediment metagenome]